VPPQVSIGSEKLLDQLAADAFARMRTLRVLSMPVATSAVEK